MLCVYRLEEALALRAGGITMPVLILGPVPPEGLDDALAAKAELALWSTGEFARRLAKRRGTARRAQRCTSKSIPTSTGSDSNRTS